MIGDQGGLMEKKYQGSCHCGKVKYEIELDFAKGTGRCNCTFCSITRNWAISTTPDKFKLHANKSDVGEYQMTEFPNFHCFCNSCGVRTHTRGHVKEMGGDFISVSIPTLKDMTPEQLANLEIKYMDGLHNNWWNPPAVTSYL